MHTISITHEIQKNTMQAIILAQLGMECSRHGLSLPHRDRIVAFRRDDFDSRAHAFNFRCADEHHLELRGR